MHHLSSLLGLGLLVAPSSASFSAQDAPVFTNLDVFQLEVAADPRIAPGGESVAYVRRSMDIMTDRARGSLWLVSADGGRHRPLVADTTSVSLPRWSPSGDRLAYVTEVAGHGGEIHVRWMDTGETALASQLPESPGALAWSPDGTRIAFTMFVAGEEPTLATPPKAPEGAEWAPPVTVIEALKYRADGSGYLETGNTHVFVLSAEGGTPRQLTSGDFDHEGPLSWSPDGTRIAFSAHRSPDYAHEPMESEIWSLSVATGELNALTDRDGPDTAPTYSPDGRRIAYLGFDDRRMGYHNAGVYVMDADGGDVRALTAEFDRSIAAVQWAGGSEQLLVQYDDRGERRIATLGLDGALTPLVRNVGGESLGRPYTSGGFSVSRDGSFAYTAGTPMRPADVALARPGASAVRLTALNEDLLAQRSLGAVEEITWDSSVDEYELQGWLVKPPGFDPEQRYPLLLEIHGGPFAAYGPHFSAELQLFAAAGYVVLYTNPRGSTSYGDAFANEIHHDYPSQDYDDLMAGVDAVLAQGFVDPEQLFVTGGSGGGVLTAWIVGKTDRFRAAASIKPVINWTSTVLTTDIAAFMPGYWFASPPWEDHDAYWRRSPLSLVGNVTTPTLLMTGEADHRTPITESEQFYAALSLRKVDTALVRVPEASHGIARRPSHLIAKVDNILAWFERYR
ncbi:MAG: S9 family peptidase [Planctomycetota bacterium]